MALAACIATLKAASIAVPNGSFELPVSTFVDINFDSWQKTPKPDWYAEGGGFLWNQLTGVFKNTAEGAADHIDNCDGHQAVWLFAVPEAGLFQDYNSVDWNDPAPTHALDATFEIGSSYALMAGVIGGGGAMAEGVTLELSLYYRDDASNKVRVAGVTITNSPTIFINRTHFIDFRVLVPVVRLGDPWAGRNIGVQMLSTVSTNLQGGYWDVDHVRLLSVREPVLKEAIAAAGQFTFTLASEPGSLIEILATTEIAMPTDNWTSLGIVTNLTGTLPFVESEENRKQRFYRARQLP